MSVSEPSEYLREPASRSPDIPYYVKALAMGVPALMLGLQIAGWIFFLPGAMRGHCDFRHLYVSAYMVRTAHAGELYDYRREQEFQNQLVSQEAIALPFNHLACEALLFLPYSYLPYRVGYFAFLFTNILLLLLTVRIMRPWTGGLSRVFPWLPTAMFLTFLPAGAALMQGQDSIIVLLLFAGAFVLLSDGKPFSSGFLVGLGLFKFQIVIPVAVLFLLWRRWRFVLGLVCSSITLLLISTTIVGIAQMNIFAHSLISMSLNETATDQARFAIHPIDMPNLRGLIYAVMEPSTPRFWVQAITLFASLLVVLWTTMKGMRRRQSEQILPAVTSAALVSYHLLIHDLSILLIPMSFCLSFNFTSEPATGYRAAVASAVMFSAQAMIGLTPIHPFILSLPLIFLLASLGHSQRDFHPPVTPSTLNRGGSSFPGCQ